MVFSPLTIPILTSDILIILLMFVFVTFLLLIIILRTKINWILKLFIIISSTVVYVFAYQGMMGFAGWPSEKQLPDRFQIHWTFVKEPDKFTKAEGAIFLWIEELDDSNVPQGIPRSYRLPYTPPLEDEISDVQENIEMGVLQAAEVKKLNKEELDLYNQKTRENTLTSQDRESQGYQLFDSYGGVYQITFGELPEAELPDKSPF
tara:strand:- start:402 stop:1016 length:615 start_codon:yes stop_codon:yes gene_type:complete